LLAAQQEFSRNLQKLRASQAEALFIIESPELATVCSHVPDDLEGTVEEIGQQINSALATGLAGIDIHESGLKKIRDVAAKNPTIDIRKPENRKAIYRHLDDPGVLNDTDRTSSQTTVPQPVVDSRHQSIAPQKPSLNDIERIDTSTRSGEAEAKRLVTELAEYELAPLVSEWEASLYQNVHLVLTSEDRKRITAMFQKFNLSWSKKKSYDIIGRTMVGQGFWSDSALTAEEKEAIAWEKRTERSDTFEARRELANRLQQFGQKILG